MKHPIPSLTAVLVAGAALLAPAVAHADPVDDALAALPETAWAASITPLEPGIVPLDRSITPFEHTTTDNGATVISLSADILFAFDKAALTDRATTKIRDLTESIPKRATVTIGGHTDSLGTRDYNKKLSTDRANAVAAVLRAARPDLHLTITGHGADQPVEPNTRDGKDNPTGRAANRRVEIRYDS